MLKWGKELQQKAKWKEQEEKASSRAVQQKTAHPFSSLEWLAREKSLFVCHSDIGPKITVGIVAGALSMADRAPKHHPFWKQV